jgi:glycerophosphoryl diester phosphodiesterase
VGGGLQLLRGSGGVTRVGHRGAAALAPENSLAAIEAAAVHGADAVELDVSRAADGALVLAHGPEVPPGAPPLGEGLALAARLGLAVQLDLKLDGAARDAVEALRAHSLLERAFVSSSSLRALAEFRDAAPALPRALTYPDDRYGLSARAYLRPGVRVGLAALRALLPLRLPAWLRVVDAAAATLNRAVVSPRAIEVCHRVGVAVFVWTVDDAARAETLAERGVDGIITDDPRLLARTLRP